MLDSIERNDRVGAISALTRRRPVAPTGFFVLTQALQNAAIGGGTSAALNYAILPRPETVGAYALAHALTGAVCAFVAAVAVCRAFRQRPLCSGANS